MARSRSLYCIDALHILIKTGLFLFYHKTFISCIWVLSPYCALTQVSFLFLLGYFFKYFLGHLRHNLSLNFLLPFLCPVHLEGHNCSKNRNESDNHEDNVIGTTRNGSLGCGNNDRSSWCWRHRHQWGWRQLWHSWGQRRWGRCGYSSRGRGDRSRRSGHNNDRGRCCDNGGYSHWGRHHRSNTDSEGTGATQVTGANIVLASTQIELGHLGLTRGAAPEQRAEIQICDRAFVLSHHCAIRSSSNAFRNCLATGA